MTDLENLYLTDQEQLKKQIKQHLKNDDTDALNIINEKFDYKVVYRFYVSRTLLEDGCYVTSNKKVASDIRNEGLVPADSYNDILWDGSPEEKDYDCEYEVDQESVEIQDLVIKNLSPELGKVLPYRWVKD